MYERGGYEYRGGAGGTFLVDFHADSGGRCDITFKADYVAIFLHGCPDCCQAPYQVIVPPLLGKVPVVALFDSVNPCGRPQVEALHAQGVTVLVDQKAHEGGRFIGGRIGNISNLPDSFKDFLAATTVYEKHTA